ncbi:hypothetical protein GCM10011361_06810 [Muriicola marianensis]|uniref:DUF922 domain-containing protein n=2 Tax=Muriicola marianensis TaxID=1324801 RepID=A0ABQ1QU57_9FLAO|nr:hypothetical protein GCM10011361_06810 [Muriicola marianensis]
MLCGLVSCLCSGQEDPSILWEPDYRLSWSDFKAPPPPDSQVAATTASGIAYSFSAIEEGREMKVDWTVASYFYPESSWYRPELANPNILSHEQLHFDISELFARRMREKIRRFRFSSEVKAEMRAIYNETIEEMREFQRRYDAETNYSRAEDKQREWNRMIAESLRRTQD